MGPIRSRLQKVIALFALCLVCLGAKGDEFRIFIHGTFFTRGQDVMLTIHVPFSETNRSIEYGWDGEHGDGSSSEISLVENDHISTRVTWDRWLKHAQSGHHDVWVVLHATDGDRRLRAEFEIQ